MSIQAPPPPVPTDDARSGAGGTKAAYEPVGKRTYKVLSAVPTSVLWGLVVIWTLPVVPPLRSTETRVMCPARGIRPSW